MKLRGSLLLANQCVERKEIEEKIGESYNHRSRILHGKETSEKDFGKRFMSLEDIRSLVRETIKASIDVLNMPNIVRGKTMAETIDNYLYNKLASLNVK